MAIGPVSGGSAGDPDVMVEINTTPLIDVMLVLLIMLIVTIPIQLHAVNLALASGAPPPSAPPAVVSIAIDADGVVSWNGEVLAGRDALEARLREAAGRPDPPEVHLRPDHAVAYKHVAAVLAAAQREKVARLGIVGSERLAD